MFAVYKPITHDEAKEKGQKVNASINGKEYTGYEYQGYFYHRITDIGNCKILSKYCDNVRRINHEKN